MTNKTRSFIIAIGAMSAAWIATQLVPWQTVSKACLAGVVAGLVVTILMYTVPRKPETKPGHLEAID